MATTVKTITNRRPEIEADISSLVDALFYSFDLGAGEEKGVSSVHHKIIRFEPVIAPLSDKATIKSEETSPTFSLKEAGKVEVFGVKDVFDHGKRALIRRLSGMDRYLDPDYIKLFKVMLFHAFRKFVNGDCIQPSGIVSVPVNVYDDEDKRKDVHDSLVGAYEIADVDGSILRAEILPERIMIVPEGYGQNQYRMYDPVTLERRSKDSASGSTILVDIGYETSNEELYEGAKYIRDKSYTLQRAGAGVIARAVHTWANKELRGVDVSRIDKGLRKIAGIPLDAEKVIEVAPGITVDIQPIYDPEIVNLAQRISHDVETNYATESANRVALGGGMAYHVQSYIQISDIPIEVTPDAEIANALGGLIKLYRQALGKK